jgi:hypothetical protein
MVVRRPLFDGDDRHRQPPAARAFFSSGSPAGDLEGKDVTVQGDGLVRIIRTHIRCGAESDGHRPAAFVDFYFLVFDGNLELMSGKVLD